MKTKILLLSLCLSFIATPGYSKTLSCDYTIQNPEQKHRNVIQIDRSGPFVGTADIPELNIHLVMSYNEEMETIDAEFSEMGTQKFIAFFATDIESRRFFVSLPNLELGCVYRQNTTSGTK